MLLLLHGPGGYCGEGQSSTVVVQGHGLDLCRRHRVGPGQLILEVDEEGKL